MNSPPILEPILVGIESDVHWGLTDLAFDPWPHGSLALPMGTVVNSWSKPLDLVLRWFSCLKCLIGGLLYCGWTKSDFSHHFTIVGPQCLLVFTGASNHSRVSERWCEMDFATIHSMSNYTYFQTLLFVLGSSAEATPRISENKRDEVRAPGWAFHKGLSSKTSQQLLLP